MIYGRQPAPARSSWIDAHAVPAPWTRISDSRYRVVPLFGVVRGARRGEQPHD